MAGGYPPVTVIGGSIVERRAVVILGVSGLLIGVVVVALAVDVLRHLPEPPAPA